MLLVLLGVHPPHACLFFFFNDTATTEIYTLSLHDALPISPAGTPACAGSPRPPPRGTGPGRRARSATCVRRRSEEHTSELQSQSNLVCRLLLEKKKEQKLFSRSKRKTNTRIHKHQSLL